MTTLRAHLPAPPLRDPDAVILPHNLDAERSTLGAAIVHPDAADYISDHLTPEAYFRRAHQTLFVTIRTMRLDGEAVDFVTLKQRLGAKKLDDVGGPAYITSLADGIPRSTNISYYVGILKDLQAKRALLAFGNRTLDLVVAGEHSSESLLADADRRLLELQNGHIEGRLRALSDSYGELLTDFAWRCDHRGELRGLPTGFESLNTLTTGWEKGALIIIAARPSIGKTTFLMNTALAAAQAGKRVAVFSLEMRRQQLEYRAVSSLSGVMLSRILNGNLGAEEQPRVANAMARHAQLLIEIDDRGGQTALEIRSHCRRLKAEGGLDLVVIDYVQLMQGSLERRGATRNDEVTDISRRLKVLADEVEAPVLLASQLTRDSEKRTDPRPKLSDLRESGALEQDADMVGFLHRKNHREGGTTEFILEKQRNGPTGTLNLTLTRETVTFTDGGESVPEPAQPAKAPRQRSFSQRWSGKR